MASLIARKHSGMFHRMKWDLVFRRLLLIYQLPKTGSQTVEATVQGCRLPHHIFRVHYLNPDSAQRVRSAVDSKEGDGSWRSTAIAQLDMATCLAKTITWRKRLRRCGIPIPKLEVITGVRELIGLALSSVFQNYRYFVPNKNDLSVAVCREALLRPHMFTALENWFDRELKWSCGVDVYKTRFPRRKGYAVYESRDARILLYRIEALPKLREMLREFLGCEVPTIIHRNVASEKCYADQYAFVRKHLRLPRAFVAKKLGTAIMRHFYSNKEREAFALQWSERPGSEVMTTELGAGSRSP